MNWFIEVMRNNGRSKMAFGPFPSSTEARELLRENGWSKELNKEYGGFQKQDPTLPGTMEAIIKPLENLGSLP